jgi:hypothetical protein
VWVGTLSRFNCLVFFALDCTVSDCAHWSRGWWAAQALRTMKKPSQSQSATTTYSDGEEELGDDDDMDCLNIDAALEKLRAPPPLTW